MRTRPALRAAVAALCSLAAACTGDLPSAPPASRPQASVSGLTATGALYDQLQTGSGIASVGTGGSALVADDFAVPAGASWTVSRIVLSGRLSASFATLPISIHQDDGGKPGAAVAAVDLAPSSVAENACCGSGPSGIKDYTFELSTPVTLAEGTYWLASEGTTAGVTRFEYHAVVSAQTGAAAQRSVDGGASWMAGFASGTNLGFALYAPAPAGQQAQSITFPAITPSPAVVGASAALGATASSGLAVAYASLTPGKCAVNGSTVTFVAAGTCTIAADQAGDASWLAAARVTRDVKVDYGFVGFAAPVDNDVMNAAKAGQAIPLRWRVLDASGAPVTTLASVSVSVASLACDLGSSVDLVEEYAAGASGLQNLGNGYYQLNWKTPSGYARSCKTLQLDLGEGSGPRTARFQFTK